MMKGWSSAAARLRRPRRRSRWTTPRLGRPKQMPVRIDDAWSYHGLKVIRLENEILALDVLPQRGGNIFRLIDKQRDLDLLWKSPRVVPHLAAIHADFDDHWAGGWDDAFPGGRASRNRYGDLLPYMGEVWTQPAGYSIDRPALDVVQLRTTVSTPVTPGHAHPHDHAERRPAALHPRL